VILCFRCLALGWVLLWSGLPLYAAAVSLVGMPDRFESTPVVPAVFGNRKQAFDLAIDNAAAQSGALWAQLFQVSGDLSVSIGALIPLQDTVALVGAPSQRLRISLTIPDVKQRAEILVRLSLVHAGSPGMPIALGGFRLEVFPLSITKELTNLLQSGTGGPTPVVLFGKGRKFRQFLTSVNVSFDDAGATIPDRFEPNRVYFGEATATASLPSTQEMATAHTVIFSPDVSLPPGIYIEQKASGAVIQVTLPLLENLADDPRNQLALIKVIHLLSL
jgi:hypothetical protein